MIAPYHLDNPGQLSYNTHGVRMGDYSTHFKIWSDTQFY